MHRIAFVKHDHGVMDCHYACLIWLTMIIDHDLATRFSHFQRSRSQKFAPNKAGCLDVQLTMVVLPTLKNLGFLEVYKLSENCYSNVEGVPSWWLWNFGKERHPSMSGAVSPPSSSTIWYLFMNWFPESWRMLRLSYGHTHHLSTFELFGNPQWLQCDPVAPGQQVGHQVVHSRCGNRGCWLLGCNPAPQKQNDLTSRSGFFTSLLIRLLLSCWLITLYSTSICYPRDCLSQETVDWYPWSVVKAAYCSARWGFRWAMIHQVNRSSGRSYYDPPRGSFHLVETGWLVTTCGLFCLFYIAKWWIVVINGHDHN